MLAGLAFCEMPSQHPQSAFQGSSGVPRGGSAAVCDPNPPRPFARYRNSLLKISQGIPKNQGKEGQGTPSFSQKYGETCPISGRRKKRRIPVTLVAVVVFVSGPDTSAALKGRFTTKV